MPRGARKTAREKAEEAVEKAKTRFEKLTFRQNRLSAELHQIEAELNECSRTIAYLKQHPALTQTYDRGGIPAPGPITFEGTPARDFGPLAQPEPVLTPERREAVEIPSDVTPTQTHDVTFPESPKLTPNQVDPRDEPGEQIPPITYDPPKREPEADDSRERFVQADPFA